MKLQATALTNATATGLIDAGVAAIAAGDVEFDLSSVTEVDSAAVALLLAWQRRARAADNTLRLVGVPAGLASLAKLYGVDELLGIGDPQHAPAGA